MNKIINSLKLLLMIIVCTSCYPSEDISTSDLDLVVTQENRQLDFSNFNTFSLPDTVVKIVDGEGRNDLPSAEDALMLNLVRSNLIRLGYTEEVNSNVNSPDLIVLVTAQEDEVFEVARDYPFWFFWGWWQGWFPGWGFGDDWSGVSPFVPVSSRYNAGTIFIYILDPNTPNISSEQVPIVWSAVVNGVIRGSQSSIEERITNNINQAFDQSQYLNTN